jgi:hypothetical protein
MFHVRVSEGRAAFEAYSTVSQATDLPSALACSYATVQRRLVEKDY